MDIAKIERVLAEFFRKRRLPIAPDGLGDHHVVIVSKCPDVPGQKARYSLLPTSCPLMTLCGEECGFDMERLNISDLAKYIAEELNEQHLYSARNYPL
jgi:hypothetical protein